MTADKDELKILAVVGLLAVVLWAIFGCAAPTRTVVVDQKAASRAHAVEVTCTWPDLPADAAPADVELMELARLYAGFGMPHFNGSAVAVGPAKAVTAAHVLDCELPLSTGKAWAGSPDYIEVDGRVSEVVAKTGDAALLVTAAGQLYASWAELGEDPRPGQVLCRVPAYPDRGGWKCGEFGEWGEGDEWMGAGYFSYKVSGSPGNSGSGVYGPDGRLVGIHVAGAGDLSGAYAVSRWRGMLDE